MLVGGMEERGHTTYLTVMPSHYPDSEGRLSHSPRPGLGWAEGNIRLSSAETLSYNSILTSTLGSSSSESSSPLESVVLSVAGERGSVR